MGLHEGSVRPYLLDRQAPAALIADQHLGVGLLLDPSDIQGVPAANGITGGRAGADVQTHVIDQLIAVRDVPGFLRHSELRPGNQISDLKSIAVAYIGYAGAFRRLQLRRRQRLSLELVELLNAEGHIVLVLYPAVVSVRIPHIVDLFLVWDQIVAHIDAVRELRIVILRITGIRGKRIAVFVQEHLRHGQGAQGFGAHVVHVIHLFPVPDGRCRHLIILQRFAGGMSVLACNHHVVGLDLVKDRSIDAAFDDIVFDGLVAAMEGYLRRISRLQEEDVRICHAVDLICLLIGHRFVAALEVDVHHLHVVHRADDLRREPRKAFDAALFLPPDLVGEGKAGIGHLARAGDLLTQIHSGFLPGGQIEAHMEVRGIGAPLHVEHRHSVARIVPKNIIPVFDHEYPIIADQVRFHFLIRTVGMVIPVSRLEPVLQRLVFVVAVAGDLAVGEVHPGAHGGVDAAQIQHQHAVHEQPEVVVSGELEYDVVAPVVLAVGALRKVGLQLHAEVEVDAVRSPIHGAVRDRVQHFVVPGIQGIQLLAVDVIRVPIGTDPVRGALNHLVRTVRIQIVIGIELAVPQGLGGIGPLFHGAQLIVHLEVISVRQIQIGVVLRAVELVIAAFVIGPLDEEVIDRIGVAEQLPQRVFAGVVFYHLGIIALIIIAGRQQTRLRRGSMAFVATHHVGL